MAIGKAASSLGKTGQEESSLAARGNINANSSVMPKKAILLLREVEIALVPLQERSNDKRHHLSCWYQQEGKHELVHLHSSEWLFSGNMR